MMAMEMAEAKRAETPKRRNRPKACSLLNSETPRAKEWPTYESSKVMRWQNEATGGVKAVSSSPPKVFAKKIHRKLKSCACTQYAEHHSKL